MVSAIGSSLLPAAAGNLSTRGLGAQLDQYQKQLSELESCPSCKTPAGQSKVAELTGRINALQHRIDSNGTASTLTTEVNRPVVQRQNSMDSPSPGYAVAGHQPPWLHAVGGAIGGSLDVYA